MKRRTTLPDKTNKYYLTKGYGGYNPCILGNSTHRYCAGSVLVNCVGHATARFNEIIDEKKCEYLGNTNAENFYALAKKQGLEVGQTPRAGACMVWAKGKIGVGSDGAGHVAIVERVLGSNTIETSESGWGYKNSYMTFPTRGKGNGNWGLSGYTFLGFVYNPKINPYANPTSKTLKKGMKGNEIKWLQWAIKKAGFNIAIDGSFGPATLSALKKAQAKWGLVADGFAGPATQAKIKSLYTLE